jgi:predicted oxidoreductase (fatty acid repression mutant protein)
MVGLEIPYKNFFDFFPIPSSQSNASPQLSRFRWEPNLREMGLACLIQYYPPPVDGEDDDDD